MYLNVTEIAEAVALPARPATLPKIKAANRGGLNISFEILPVIVWPSSEFSFVTQSGDRRPGLRRRP